ncbi:neural cell adhesion molecule L1 isoform X2 [Ambystoma mexicanum]|uniref:neural cell adhesion molecule L1 isoform X2 n=1 Tax=Ambystoma mexicanum TaxID=8296 RepID=UPI0037E7CA66
MYLRSGADHVPPLLYPAAGGQRKIAFMGSEGPRCIGRPFPRTCMYLRSGTDHVPPLLYPTIAFNLTAWWAARGTPVILSTGRALVCTCGRGDVTCCTEVCRQSLDPAQPTCEPRRSRADAPGSRRGDAPVCGSSPMAVSRMCARWALLPLLLALCSPALPIEIPKGYKWQNLTMPPSITEQSPETYVVYPINDIQLQCEAKDQENLMFRWTQNGTFFDPLSDPRVKTRENSGTMTIANSNGIVMKSYRGKYRCYVSNDLGTAISTEINLIAESTPTWAKEEIPEFKVEEGKSVVLPCNPPVSALPPRIIWMNNKLLHILQDERVSMGLNGKLYFANVVANDSRPDYICHAQFIQARTIIQKEAIKLQVTPTNSIKLQEPKFLMPPGSTSSYLALKGSLLQLECIAEGYPTPEIWWERLNGEVPNGRVTYHSFRKILQISNVAEEDDGEYQCTVSNQKGTAKHVYTVAVEAAPYWIKKPKSSMYSPGETARLDCEVYGKPKPKVTWKINGVPVKELDPNPYRRVKDNALILSSVQPNDTVVAQCEAVNKHGHILANAYIYVIKLPPQIETRNNKSYQVVEKRTAFMHCKSFGAPVPTIQWMDERQEDILQKERYFLLTNGTLRISDVQWDDSGLYTCAASNDQDTVYITATLSVKNATRIIQLPQDMRVKRGEAASFECLALFDPSFVKKSVRWKMGEKDVEETSDSDKYFIEEGTLTVYNVDYDDEGIYTCVAESPLDSVEESAELVVVDRPAPPRDLELTDRKDRGVTLTWLAGDDNNSPIEEYIIEYEEDSFTQDQWHELKRVDGTLNSVELELSPWVNYQFRVTAVNEVGKSKPSSSSDRFETAKAAPDKNPKQVKGRGNDPSNMYIYWEPMKGIDWNGPGFRYIVKWRLQHKETEWHTQEVDSPPWVVHETPTFAQYEIKVQSYNEIGEGPEPEVYIGYSGENYPTAYPINVGVLCLNWSTIEVTWSPVPKESINGHLLGYKIYYWIERQTENRHKRHTMKHLAIIRGDHHRAEISGLEPYKPYNLDVRVFNGKGDGPPSEVSSFTTPEGVPGKPASLHLEYVSETSVHLVWTAPLSPNGVLTAYLLQYQPVNKTHAGSLNNIMIEDPQKLNWTLSKLDPKELYRFYVRAFTKEGEGVPFIIEGKTELETEFPPVTNITFWKGDNYTIIRWEPVEGHRDMDFQIKYMNKNSVEPWRIAANVSSAQRTYHVTGLMPGTNYRFKLVTWNQTHEVDIWDTEVLTSGIDPVRKPGGFATEGWFIGLISAIVLLLLILLILCFIKRSKGGKYSVKDKEDTQVDSEARPMKDETFGEYSDNEEKPFTSSQPSLNGELIKPLGSDDSLADYGGSVDVQFNEDGSFIGQYSGKKDEKEPAVGHDSSGATSPVNPVVALE